jgi:hypothetical protein
MEPDQACGVLLENFFRAGLYAPKACERSAVVAANRALGNVIARVAISGGMPLVTNVHDVYSEPISGSKVGTKST